MPIDRWLFENLVCPRDDEPMELFGAQLKCANGHAYRIVDGIPILLRDDVDHVHWAAVRRRSVVDRAPKSSQDVAPSSRTIVRNDMVWLGCRKCPCESL